MSTRQSLESGKHVLVEYPVALSSATAKDLYSLAATKGNCTLLYLGCSTLQNRGGEGFGWGCRERGGGEGLAVLRVTHSHNHTGTQIQIQTHIHL